MVAINYTQLILDPNDIIEKVRDERRQGRKKGKKEGKQRDGGLCWLRDKLREYAENRKRGSMELEGGREGGGQITATRPSVSALFWDWLCHCTGLVVTCLWGSEVHRHNRQPWRKLSEPGGEH